MMQARCRFFERSLVCQRDQVVPAKTSDELVVPFQPEIRLKTNFFVVLSNLVGNYRLT